MMRKLALAAISACLLHAGPAAAQKYNLTVAGYSPGGLVSTIGAGMDAALATAFPGSTVTYQTSSGGLANAILVSTGKVPLGIISDTELPPALDGKPPFKAPIKNLRLLIQPYVAESRFQVSHIIFSKAWSDRHGITSFEQIATKKPSMRVAFNRPGNRDGDVGLAFMSAIKVSQDDIRSWGGQVVRAASQEITSLMLDRRLDGVVVGISIKHPRILEITKGLDTIMLPSSRAVAESVAKETGAEPCTVKAKEYDMLAADTTSVCVGVGLYASASMPDETAYNYTKAMFEQIDKFRSAHRLLKAVVTPERLAKPTRAPFHPGAAKYLREKGLLK
ncbi:MAG: TAXI family TRAP transporter solute-binding subunit [Hyphomicrobiaceae bacterium]